MNIRLYNAEMNSLNTALAFIQEKADEQDFIRAERELDKAKEELRCLY